MQQGACPLWIFEREKRNSRKEGNIPGIDNTICLLETVLNNLNVSLQSNYLASPSPNLGAPMLKMEAVCSSETSVDFCQTSQRYIPEDLASIVFSVRTQNPTIQLKVSNAIL
jgi:hypothetical protein